MENLAGVQMLSMEEATAINGGNATAIGTSSYFTTQQGEVWQDFYFCDYNWMTESVYCVWASEIY
ncbi:hypothetical protein H8S90_10000 [Olivibacter sp. SDN3]|uniref:hypothetical protein n=1 Tax=Olivibacter sp. SDN3 TaxID=2764720 RepID=UPI00165197DD|nr:hypothetical protein [Olivibacter sp. SDN3]QNL51874.1 hypothetical protein H8S90_10000 [Olivibacter sp. SDN3]